MIFTLHRKKSNKQVHFKQWTRKAYAVFNSLKCEVKIAALSISLEACFIPKRKTNLKPILVSSGNNDKDYWKEKDIDEGELELYGNQVQVIVKNETSFSGSHTYPIKNKFRKLNPSCFIPSVNSEKHPPIFVYDFYRITFHYINVVMRFYLSVNKSNNILEYELHRY